MDLIAQAYDEGEDNHEGEAEKAPVAAEAAAAAERPASPSSSGSSEYYSTSDDSSSDSSSDGDTAGDSDSSSASSVDAAAGAMIDNLIKSRGWEIEEEDTAADGVPRTRNEVEPEVPEAPLAADLLQAKDSFEEVGSISGVVESTVVVQHKEGCNVYDIGSVLCVQKQAEAETGAETGAEAAASFLPLGYVDEVFGPVKAPLYSLRCDSATIASHCRAGVRVFGVQRLSSVVVEKSLYTKGYDNSGKHDEEVLPGEEDAYSDDEKEIEARKQRRQRKRQSNGKPAPKPRAGRQGQPPRGGGAPGMRGPPPGHYPPPPHMMMMGGPPPPHMQQVSALTSAKPHSSLSLSTK